MRILILLLLSTLLSCAYSDEYSRDVYFVPEIIYRGYDTQGYPVWGHDTNEDNKIDYCAQYTYDKRLKEISRWEGAKDGKTCNR
jgi:hypothetical protein